MGKVRCRSDTDVDIHLNRDKNIDVDLKWMEFYWQYFTNIEFYILFNTSDFSIANIIEII